MRVVITGAAGFIGQKLAQALAKAGTLDGQRIDELALFDVVEPKKPASAAKVTARVGNIAARAEVEALIGHNTGAVFHLAAIVSGQAEAEFDLGMSVNLDATRSLLEAARARGRRPKFVFTSSLAVFGPPLPRTVTEETALHPQSSYGVQKAVGELLVADFSRKGFVDGCVLRLPTVCVRPGSPNAAASSFVSGIIREPLGGKPANCPVGRDLELWLSSPRAVVANLVHAASVPGGTLGPGRVVNLPGITVSVGEMIEALERVAGPRAAGLISFNEDATVRRIVSSWPARFDVRRALELGFVRDPDFVSLVRDFLGGDAPFPLRKA